MRVGVIQSCYVPWRGYFDFISQVDLFVFYDDVQFSKGSWRNRNRIKTREGLRWLTVPVHHAHLEQLIDETELVDSRDWAGEHLRLLESAYRDAPWFETYLPSLSKILQSPWPSLSALNITLTQWVMRELGISTPTLSSRELNLEGRKTDRLIQLLQGVGATTYLSGPSASGYLETDAFRRAGIALEFKAYDYGEYPQLWGPFEGAVTVLDLLFNVGPDAARHLPSGSPNARVV